MSSTHRFMSDMSPIHDPWRPEPEPDTGGRTRPEPLPAGPIALAPDGQPYTWGPIQAVHTVGDIAVIEYLLDTSNHSATQAYVWDQHGQTRFQAYVDGKRIFSGHSSLDSALVGAIDYKRRGSNSQAAHHFDLMTLGTLPTNEV